MPALKQPMGKPDGRHALTEARVEEIAATVRKGKFQHGVTLPAFAKKWDLCQQRVHELSSLAMKKIREEHAADGDRIRAKGFGMMERIADDSIAAVDEDPENASTHRTVALKAVDTWLVRSGAAAPSKAVVGVVDFAALTDEQLEAKAQELIAKLKGAT